MMGPVQIARLTHLLTGLLVTAALACAAFGALSDAWAPLWMRICFAAFSPALGAAAFSVRARAGRLTYAEDFDEKVEAARIEGQPSRIKVSGEVTAKPLPAPSETRRQSHSIA
jgi:hypothetical protein